MSEAIITVEGLGKRYRLGASRSNERYTALRDVIAEKAAGFFKKLKTEKLKSGNGQNLSVSASQHLSVSDAPPAREDFWALKDVSFEVKQGEVLGIIGRNGAGKSTLLKILSRITEPTEGRIKIKGRVASLLEVGTGFHPELTGRENIFLNGAILGMHRAEIKAKFDEIVAFAETEKFLDTPVKRYSSGMYVRLAFAVAAHLEPEILVVDEVLAVGDAEFQKKCLGKMQQVAKGEGRTVLFVSHNMGAVNQLCSRALLLADGKLIRDGSTAQVVKTYTAGLVGSGAEAVMPERFSGPLKDVLLFERIELMRSDDTPAAVVAPSEPIRIRLHGACGRDVSAFRTTLAVFHHGIRLFSMHDVADAESLRAGTRFMSTFELPVNFLRPGDYQIAIGGHSARSGEWLWGTEVAGFEVLEEWSDSIRQHDTGIVTVPRVSRREEEFTEA